MLSLLVVGFAALTSATRASSPPSDLPVVWDSSPEPASAVKSGILHVLNPYNSIRPEYRDAPPSQTDLEKIWQHHMKDHVYKSPFVRPMKSGLWEAGVPNRYAPSGYNRRKFKSESDALSYVRHKTGAGSNIDYQGALKTESEIKGEKATKKKPEAIFTKGELKKASKKESSFLEMESSAEGSVEDDTFIGSSFIELAGATNIHATHHAPTSDIDKTELEVSARDTRKDDKALNEEEQHLRVSRDYNLKIAHKMRDFLGNYRPDHEVKVVDHGFKSL